MSRDSQTIRAIYEAFGRGDVAAILATLAPDVDWEHTGACDEVPWLQARRGSAAVGGFFGAIHEHLEFLDFEVRDVVGGEGVVVALIDLRARVRRTGETIVERDEAHIWRFDAEGRVARFRHGTNTQRHLAAWRG